jgi:hypothetical protein
LYTRRWIRILSVFLTTWLLLSGCAKPTELPKGADSVWHLVVIGDSSLWGLGEVYASQIEKDVGVKVELKDFALATLSAGEVLEVLQTGKTFRGALDKLPDALGEAEVVVIFVNPLFSIDPVNPLNMDGCFENSTPDSCGSETFKKYTTDMKMIWAKIFELRVAQPTILRATDIYNPLIVNWNETGIFDDCTKCWENMANAARLAAEAYNIPFLSRYDAFKGVNHNEDPIENGYILSDGEHPSDLANQFTAELFSKMGYEPGLQP